MSPTTLMVLLDFYMEQVTEENCGSILDINTDKNMEEIIKLGLVNSNGSFTEKGLLKIKKVLG